MFVWRTVICLHCCPVCALWPVALWAWGLNVCLLLTSLPHCVGCRSLLWSCQADMALWQRLPPSGPLLPQDPREHRPSLFPICWATNRTKQNMSCSAAKRPIIERHYGDRCYYSCVSNRSACSHCPRIYRGFPRGMDKLFPSSVFNPHISSAWEPLILASTQKNFV